MAKSAGTAVAFTLTSKNVSEFGPIVVKTLATIDKDETKRADLERAIGERKVKVRDELALAIWFLANEHGMDLSAAPVSGASKEDKAALKHDVMAALGMVKPRDTEAEGRERAKLEYVSGIASIMPKKGVSRDTAEGKARHSVQTSLNNAVTLAMDTVFAIVQSGGKIEVGTGGAMKLLNAPKELAGKTGERNIELDGKKREGSEKHANLTAVGEIARKNARTSAGRSETSTASAQAGQPVTGNAFGELVNSTIVAIKALENKPNEDQRRHLMTLRDAVSEVLNAANQGDTAKVVASAKNGNGKKGNK